MSRGRRTSASVTPPGKPVPPASSTELPEGFKMAELGPLPEEWRVAWLGEVADVIMGQSPPSNTYNTAMKGMPFLQGKAEFGNVHPHPIKWCSQPLKTAKPNDVLVSVRAPVGDVNLADKEYCIGRGLASIRVKPEILDAYFVYYYLVLTKEKLQEKGTGSTFQSINKSILLEFPIPVPAFREQRAVAHVLRTVQRAKEATERVIAALKELKKSLMRHLFTYGPVPVDQADQVPLKETELGPAPEHWEVVPIGQVGRVITGRTPPTSHSEYWNGSIPFITPVDLQGGPVRTTQRSITNEGLRKARPLPRGAVLVSCIGYIGKVGVVDSDVAVTNQQINAIVPQRVDSWFLAFALMHETALLESRARMTTVPILHKTNFQRVPIPLPPLDEQREIARMLQAVDARIAAEQARRAALEELFKTLLHLLMTAKLRVPYEGARHA
jgi:type I restriction enzyme S subunit